jgi:hypothetical protein
MSEIMLDVLFNTDKPTKSSDPAEFYELSLETELLRGNEIFVLKERHGWWNPALHCMVIDHVGKIQIEFRSYRDGLKAYVERMNLHMGRRFLYSFIWHPGSGEPSYHQKLGKS